MRKQHLIVWLLALFLVGCGNDPGPPNLPSSGSGGSPSTASLAVIAAQGGNVTAGGHTLSLSPGSLSQSATVGLAVLPAPPVQPAEDDFKAVGTYSRLTFGGANLTGSVNYTIPYTGTDPAHAEVMLVVDGIFIPLPCSYDANSQTFNATLDLNPVELDNILAKEVSAQSGFDGIAVGVVQETTFAVPHIPWTSYNLYHFDPATQTFKQIVSQGTPIGTIPDLGARPMLMVHGLGSNIRKQGFAKLAGRLLQNGSATGIVGFEYDTLNPISSNGVLLRQAFTQLTQVNSGRTWKIMAHSMGTLVSRSSIEKFTLPIAATGNRAVLAAGPHLGTPVIQKLQGNASLAQRFIRYVAVNFVLEFTNADFQRCEVSVTDPGFNDLAENSPFVTAQNQGASGNHPQFDYKTVGGNKPGLEFTILGFFFGIYPDDGLVFLNSANATVLGQTQSASVANNHINIYTDSPGLDQIVNFEQ